VKASNRFYIFLALTAIAVWTCVHFGSKKKDEIIVDNIHISRKPCLSAMNEFFSTGADSSKICDCLIPDFYSLIKYDSLLVEKFKQEGGFFRIEGSLNDSAMTLFANCITQNILDTNYLLTLTPDLKLAFKKKLTDGFLHIGFEGNVEALSDCITERLSGNIRIKEYFANDYNEVPKINAIITDCKRSFYDSK